MTDDIDSVREGAEADDSSAGAQTTRLRAEATLAQARAEALDLTNQAAAEAEELRAGLDDVRRAAREGSTVQHVQRAAESLADAGADLVDSERPVAAPVAATASEPEPEPEPDPEAAEVVEAEPEQDREPVPAPDEEVAVESRESLYAVTALHGVDVQDAEVPAADASSGSFVRPRGAQAGDEPAKDDLEEAPADPRPLGWLFRGH